MSKRREDESYEDYKVRQKAENKILKVYLQNGRKTLWDSKNGTYIKQKQS